MAERYIEKEWKFQRREKKRKKAIEYAKKHKKETPKPLSNKDEYTVKGYKNDDPNDVFELTVSAASFHGHPKEYQDIKLKCRKKFECFKVNILEIVTK